MLPQEQEAPHTKQRPQLHKITAGAEQVASLRNDCLPFAADPDPLPIHSVVLGPTLCSFQGFDSREIGILVLSPQSD